MERIVFRHEGRTYDAVAVIVGQRHVMRICGPREWNGRAVMSAVYDLDRNCWTDRPVRGRGEGTRLDMFMTAAAALIEAHTMERPV